jgi:hypothetical protein
VLAVDGIAALAALALWVFCLFDVITTDASLVRNLEKTWWIVIVLFFSVIGSILWLVAGRPQGQGGGAGMPYKGNMGQPAYSARGRSGYAGRSLAPDDDPEFLASVRRQNAEDKNLLSQWEKDLRAREEELRRREGGDPAPPGSPTA